MSAVAVAVGEVQSEVKNQINIRIRNTMIDDAKQNRKHTNQTNISKASDARWVEDGMSKATHKALGIEAPSSAIPRSEIYTALMAPPQPRRQTTIFSFSRFSGARIFTK